MADAYESRIALIGTGLIGASVGLNLMARKNRKYEVVGVDRSRQNARTAREMKAVDRTVRYLDEAVRDASMIVLAVPPRAAEELLTAMAPHLADGAIITDTCSSKASFMARAEQVLGARASVIGGHPMAGSERSGPAAASIDLFQGAPWAITPSRVASESAVRVVLGLVESAGAVPIYIDPAEHDEIVAAVSHVPLLLSVALFKLVRDSACWEDAEQLAGPGFRDMTRLTMGDPEMATDIVATNRPAILSWLRRYQGELDTIIEALEISDEAVARLAAESAEAAPDDARNGKRGKDEKDAAPATQEALIEGLFSRARFERFVFDDRTVGRQVPSEGSSDAPRSADMIGQMFMGAYLYGRFKDQLRRGEEREREAQRRAAPPSR